MKIKIRKPYIVALNWGEVCLMWHGRYTTLAIAARREGDLHMARIYAADARREWWSVMRFLEKGRIT